jgi:hypothetical protein
MRREQVTLGLMERVCGSDYGREETTSRSALCYNNKGYVRWGMYTLVGHIASAVY